MSQENLVENVEIEPIEDEEEEPDDDYVDELEQDPNFDGFDDAVNNVVPADDTTETIVHWLRNDTNASRRQESVNELIRRLDEDGYQENLANEIIIYIMERPCSIPELARRCSHARDVMKRWPNSGALVLNVINAVLSADESLTEIPSRNLADFIHCCLDKKAFNGRDLLISPTEPHGTSLKDHHAGQLRIRIYPNVDQRESLLDRCCRILSFLFCCNFQYI
uniref:F-box domain-containing protein n=1 Tax=Panagrellus redivivus TaxID=6233 RepID=A0A7E4VDV9_PANRE